MRESIWGYAVIILGIMAVGIIWFFANITKTDQHNYNLLKETVESAMMDSVDFAEYRSNGEVIIDEEKFVENFIRRFAENADLSNTYKIEIYDISTKPPKVSLRVSSSQSTTTSGELMTFNIVNNIDAILETEYLKGNETTLTYISKPGIYVYTDKGNTLKEENLTFSHTISVPNVSGKCFKLDRVENVKLDVRLEDLVEYCDNMHSWYHTPYSCNEEKSINDNILDHVNFNGFAEIKDGSEVTGYSLTWNLVPKTNKCEIFKTYESGATICDQIHFKYDVVWKEISCSS